MGRSGAKFSWAVTAGLLACLATPVMAKPETPSADREHKGQGTQYRLSLNDSEREVLTDQKRDEVITQLQHIAIKFDDDSPQKAELLFQLSEYDWEKSKYLYRTEMTSFEESYARYQAAHDRGDETVKPPKEDHRASEKYRVLTMGIYRRLLKTFPQYERRDEVLFALAFNLYEMGKNAEALKTYQELITRFPSSKFVADAYVQLGNHAFEHNDLDTATLYYQKALGTKIPKIYSYALYKLAWCDYNAGAYARGLKKLQDVVDFAENKKEMTDLRNEALNDLVVVYVRMDRGEEAIQYFEQKAQGPRRHRLIAKLASHMADAGRHENAVRVLRYLLDHNPVDADAPDWQQSIVKAYEGLRMRDQVRVEVRKLAALYRPGSAWWKANASKPETLKSGFGVSEEAMRTLVTEYHQEAQKTKQVETYKLARDIYADYLNAFGSSPDERFVSDYAFNLRFYHAEILWTLEDWGAAAAAYEAVVDAKIPARDTAREVARSEYRVTAAYDAILAYDNLVKIERGELAQSNLRSGQKVDEHKAKGNVDKGERIMRKSGQDRGEQPLTRAEQRLIAACDRYVALPHPKDEVDIRYQAAVVLYNKSHVVEAAKRFGQIIMTWPEERRSQEAADLTLAVLEKRNEWQELNALSHQFLANKRLCRPDSEFTRRVANIAAGSQYKVIDQLLYKKQHKTQEAAEAFLRYVDEFPTSEHAPQALTFAVVLFEELHEADRAAATGQRMLAQYPGSGLTLKVRYALARADQHMADYEGAAENYEAFVKAYDARAPNAHFGKRKGHTRDDAEKDDATLVAEAEKWVPDAMFNAGLFWEAVQKPDRAVVAYRAYLERFPDRKDAPEVAFTVGLVYEKAKRWRDAAKAFERWDQVYAQRAGGVQRYQSLYHQLLAHKELSTKDAERVRREMVRAFAKVSPNDRQDVGLVNAYAQARFELLEGLWKSYAGIRFVRVATLRPDLMAKQRKLKEVEKAYLEVLGTGSGEYGIAALTRIGMAYADLADNIRTSPNPRGLTEDQKAMYRSELENLAMPLEDKSIEALEKGLSKAYELSIYNPWTLQAQDLVNKFRPGTYDKVMGVEYVGSGVLSGGPEMPAPEPAPAHAAAMDGMG